MRESNGFAIFSLSFSFSQGNYLTMTTVDDFLQTVQTQMNFSHFNDASSFSSTTASLTEFSGLSRLELKGMNGILVHSPNYQTLEHLLNQKNPLHRIQQIRERDAKELHEQSASQASQQTLVEKPRAAGSAKSSSSFDQQKNRTTSNALLSFRSTTSLTNERLNCSFFLETFSDLI